MQEYGNCGIFRFGEGYLCNDGPRLEQAINDRVRFAGWNGGKGERNC